ncbi:MAG: ATP-binding protein [Campylobacteraceae bacterium]
MTFFGKVWKLLISFFLKKNYAFIFLLTALFLYLLLSGFEIIKKEIIYLAEKKQERILEETKSKIYNWTYFSRTSLEGSASFISKSGIFENKDMFISFLNETKAGFRDFDLIQVMLEDNRIFIDGIPDFISETKNFNPNRLAWYEDTKKERKTTITILDSHAILKEQTMNICSPILKDEVFVGSICGVIKASTIIEKIKNLSFPEDIYFFIITKRNKIAMETKNEELEKHITEKIINSESYKTIRNNSILKYDFNDELISITPLGIFDWNVGIGMKKDDLVRGPNTILRQGIIILAAFFILIIVANFIHEYVYNILNKKYHKVSSLIKIWIQESTRGIVVVDKEQEISFLNNTAKNFLKKIDNSSESLRSKFSNILKQSNEVEIVIKIDKNFFKIRTNILQVDNVYEGMVVIIEDITKDILLEQKERDYNYILMHQGKMMEMGDLVVGINHQLKQPLNGLSILMSNLLQQHQNGLLDDKTFLKNIELCQKNIFVMNDTIDLYKNYYKNSFDITEFSLKGCVQSIKEILDTKIKRNNIILEMSVDSALHVKSVENIVQQILLVLIQNAIDESVHTTKKNIHVNVKEEDEYIKIEVIDFGLGVDEKLSKKLFERPIKTEKLHGTGFGLYFANKIAAKNIDGKIFIESYKNPTIFVLKFRRFLEQKEEEG